MAESQDKPTEHLDIPDELPLLPIRDLVVFPSMVLPLFVGREISVKAVEAAANSQRMILLVTQKTMDLEVPEPKDIYTVGTVGMIMRTLKLPDGRVKVLVQGVAKARIVDYAQTEPYYLVRIERLTEIKVAEVTLELEALMRNVKEQLEKVVGFGKILLPDIMLIIENLEDPGRLADLIISNLSQKVEVAQGVLEILDPVDRLKRVGEILGRD